MYKQVSDRQFFEAEVKTVAERTGKNGPYLLWEFETNVGERLVGFTEADLQVGNRTWTWITMLGVPLKVGEGVELDELVGMGCTVFVDEKRTVRMVYSGKVAAEVTVVAPVAVKEEPKAEPGSTAEELFS